RRALRRSRMERGGSLEAGNWWQIAGDEFTPACEFARIGLAHTRRDVEEGRFARAVATDEPNVFALPEGNRRAVEDDLRAVLDGKVVRARDDCGEVSVIRRSNVERPTPDVQSKSAIGAD